MSNIKELNDDELSNVVGGYRKVSTGGYATRTHSGGITTVDEPTPKSKNRCPMIACPYTKETCINKNTNYYCDLYKQYVYEF